MNDEETYNYTDTDTIMRLQTWYDNTVNVISCSDQLAIIIMELNLLIV